MRCVAIIPVKHVSERVQSKNFCPFFNGQSLLERKIIQLKNADIFDDIYISSNSPLAHELAKKHDISFINRAEYYCSNKIAWSDVITEICKSIPEPDDTLIAWCHTTSPLFDEYKQALTQFKSLDTNKFNGLVAVRKISEFLLNEHARPINYSWGVWHPYSQDLEPTFAINGALFIATKSEMISNKYVISRKPFLYITSDVKSIDIDTPLDFKIAQFLASENDL